MNRLTRLRAEAYAPLFSEAAFYPVNLWADKPMDSKQRIQDALIEVIKRKVDDKVFEPQAKGPRLKAMTSGVAD